MSTEGFYVIERYTYRHQESKPWTDLKGRPLLIATECGPRNKARKVLKQRYNLILRQIKEIDSVGFHTIGYECAYIKTDQEDLKEVILEIKLLM